LTMVSRSRAARLLPAVIRRRQAAACSCSTAALAALLVSDVAPRTLMPSGLLRAGREAVSVASGGIVLKSDLPFASESGRWDSGHWSEPRLCVDDPLTGAPCAGTRAAEDAPSEPARRLRGLGPCPHLCLLAPGVSRLHALLRPLVLLVAAAGRDVSAGSYRISDVQLAFSKAARRLEALARGRRLTDTRCNYLEGLFDVQVARAPRSWLAVALHALRVHCCPGRQLLPGMDGPSNGGMLAPVCAKWWLPPPPPAAARHTPRVRRRRQRVLPGHTQAQRAAAGSGWQVV
jgi:hypothetical protein